MAQLPKPELLIAGFLVQISARVAISWTEKDFNRIMSITSGMCRNNGLLILLLGLISGIHQNSDGSTAAVRRQYRGSTAAVPRQYCGSTAAVPRQYRGSTAAVPWQYRDNTYIRILVQFFHVFFYCVQTQLKMRSITAEVLLQCHGHIQYKYFPKIDRSSSSGRLGQITNEVLVMIRISDVIVSVMRHP